MSRLSWLPLLSVGLLLASSSLGGVDASKKKGKNKKAPPAFRSPPRPATLSPAPPHPPPLVMPPFPPLPPSNSTAARSRGSFRMLLANNYTQDVLPFNASFKVDAAYAVALAFLVPSSEQVVLIRDVGVIDNATLINSTVPANKTAAFINGTYVDFDTEYPSIMLIPGSINVVTTWTAPILVVTADGPVNATVNQSFSTYNNWFYHYYNIIDMYGDEIAPIGGFSSPPPPPSPAPPPVPSPSPAPNAPPSPSPPPLSPQSPPALPPAPSPLPPAPPQSPSPPSPSPPLPSPPAPPPAPTPPSPPASPPLPPGISFPPPSPEPTPPTYPVRRAMTSAHVVTLKASGLQPLSSICSLDNTAYQVYPPATYSEAVAACKALDGELANVKMEESALLVTLACEASDAGSDCWVASGKNGNCSTVNGEQECHKNLPYVCLVPLEGC